MYSNLIICWYSVNLTASFSTNKCMVNRSTVVLTLRYLSWHGPPLEVDSFSGVELLPDREGFSAPSETVELGLLLD